MNIFLNYENKWFDIKKIQSKTLNFLIKQNLNKVVVYDPAARYNIKSDSFVNIRATWQHLWLIKILPLGLSDIKFYIKMFGVTINGLN